MYNCRNSDNKCRLGSKILYLWQLQHSWRDLKLVETWSVYQNCYVLKLYHNRFGKPCLILHPNCCTLFQMFNDFCPIRPIRTSDLLKTTWKQWTYRHFPVWNSIIVALLMVPLVVKMSLMLQMDYFVWNNWMQTVYLGITYKANYICNIKIAL